MTLDGYFSVQEAATELKIKRGALYERIRRQKLAVVWVSDVMLLPAAVVSDMKKNPPKMGRKRR